VSNLPMPSWLHVVSGGGEGRAPEPLDSPQAVTRALVGATADLLLRRITPPEASSIRVQVERVLHLFDLAALGDEPHTLRSELRTLEALLHPRRGAGPV
jgi:hypothetical protein